ncbi:lytic transglycosylase domain-containing protein [Nibrella viscosa]
MSTGYSRHIDALKKRTAPYFAVIEPILQRHNIPNDFKFLPLIESDLKANAVSSAGAVGYWQFMDETARDMGLKISPENDERKDLVKSTEAACRYIRFLYRKLGSWTLVAAAYNGGIGMLQNQMVRQRKQDYYTLALNEETGYYLYRILAMKELFTNSAYYERMALGPLAFTDNPYEREREQARRMGWLQDEEPVPAGEPVSFDDAYPSNSANDATIMDSILVEILKKKATSKPIFVGDAEARLFKAGKAKLGQIWLFKLTQDVQLNEITLKADDVIHAVVDDVDSRGQIFLRATNVVSVATHVKYPLAMLVINPATGQAGVSLPKALKPGWLTTWRLL